ncbi:MAG: N-acetylneuraminate synthase family protein [Chloroflexota bacterium]|nr:N-acetylneuraminate synthase family protein [Chloroflexota bacterium]
MPKTIEIAGRKIGGDQPCFIIAEGCDNHLGNMDTAREMVLQAKACGADAIKFQHHLPDEEMLREGVPMSKNFNMPLYDFLKLYALTLDEHVELMRFCEQIGIIYLCTPFSRKAAEELNEIGVQAFKIGSGELTDLPTLKRICAFGKPVILSSGMSTWDEIDETIHTLLPISEQLALMNCVSEYPAIYEDINLGVIPQLAARYDIPIGHSDHTPDIYTCFGAVAMGAKLLEKHIILDRRQPGPDQSVSIEPYELYQLVQGTRRIEVALGTEKKVHEGEKAIRSWAHRSVVSIAPIPAGTVITEEHIWTKRPGTGIAAKHLETILGKTARIDIPKDKLITWEELN